MVVVVLEDDLLLGAHGVRDGVPVLHAGLVGHRVLDHLPVLDQSELSILTKGPIRAQYYTYLNIQAPDLHEVAAVGAVVRDELRDHGHLLARVHGEVAAGAEVGVVALAPVVVVAAVLVADTVEPVVRGVVSALEALAPVLAWAGSRGPPHHHHHPLTCDLAGVVGVGRADGVGLPDVELHAAGAVLAHPGVRGGSVPVLDTIIIIIIMTIYTRDCNEPSRRFHNHRYGPYDLRVCIPI